MSDGIEFVRMTSSEEFAALRPEWDALGAESIQTVFLTHPWLYNWLTILGEGWEPRVLLARESGRLVAALPLAGRTTHGIRRLEFMGSGTLTPNHLDVIALPGYEEVAQRGFADLLARSAGTWDVVELDKLPADAPTPAALASTFGALGFRTSLITTATCPYADLPATFDEYFASISRSARRHTRERRRYLERENPEARVRTVDDEAERQQALEALVRLHQQRWESKGYAGSFADPLVARFHDAMTRDALAQGSLRFHTVVDGDTVAAALLCYRAGRSVQAYSWAWGPEWASHRLGMILNAHATEQAIAEGATCYDELEGDEPYKATWAKLKRENVRLRVFAHTARGRALMAGERIAAAAVATARQVLPEPVREAARKRMSTLRSGRQARTGD